MLHQVQGLMEVFKLQWANLYCWTPKRSAVYHIPRDEAYWAQCFPMLASFWWEHVMPARHARDAGNLEDLKAFR